MGFTLCYVKKNYFEEHKDFIRVLDVGNVNKQSKRTHLCIKIELNENSFYIPLRNNMGAEIRKFGRIGHSVPSEKRKNAGLDFRYVLIVNNPIYIEVQTERKIPASQYKCIQRDYNLIRSEFEIYLRGYRKAAQKGRMENNFKHGFGFNAFQSQKPRRKQRGIKFESSQGAGYLTLAAVLLAGINNE